MADDDTETQTAPAPAPAPSGGLPPDVLTRLIQQLTTQQTAPPTGTPDDGTKPSWTGLLGSVLGGGQAPGYQLRGGQADTSGNRALLNFGINTLLASGPHAVRPDVLSAVATGLQGAQESLGIDQRLAGAQAATAYEQNRQQQQDKLARIKEAIPLLTLQQQQKAADTARRIALGGNPPGGSIVTGGSLGSVDVPPEYLPFYQEASARTGIPAEVLIAQGRQESGFNPGATGAAGEIGIGQINPKTATDPGYGMTGLKNPAVLRDPRTNINFQADYLAARAKAAGADFSTPEGIAKALKAYNGGGDPNYVQNVTRYIPGARTALAPRPAPGQTAAATPPPPNAASPPGPLPVPPIPPANPPPVVPTVQTAGPGAGNAPPGTPTAPVDPAAAPTQAPAIFTPRALTPSEQTATSYALPPEQEAGFRRAVAEVAGQPDAAAKIAAIEQARTAAIATQREKADAARLAIEATDRRTFQTQQDDAAKFAREQAAKQADTLQTQQFEREKAEIAAKQKLAEIEATGDQTRQSSAVAARIALENDTRKQLNTESVASADTIPKLEALRALSDAVPDGSSDTLRKLATVQFGGTTLLNHMATLGLGDPTKIGPIQQLQGGISGVVASLRSGMSMGSLSDRDLTFIESLGPSLYQDQATRSAVISYLKQSMQAKIRFNTEVNKEMTRPGMNMADAIATAQKTIEDKHPIVPVVPADIYAHWNDPDPNWTAKRAEWATDNGVRQHTLYRKPNGSLAMAK